MTTEIAEHDAAAASACDVDLEGVVSSNVDVTGDLGITVSSTMLTSLYLSLVCFSERVNNLSIFVMHLATVESELKALVLEKGHMGIDSLEKGMEFDLLSGVLDSVIIELDGNLVTLQAGIADARERLSSCTHLGEDFMAMQDKLIDSEQCLKQSEVQFAEIKMQSVTFQRTLSSFQGAEKGDGEAGELVGGDDDKSLNVNTEIKMQTFEQKGHILKMLEKSLAREIDLEKNFNDLRELQEKLKLRMLSLEQELVHKEEESVDVLERWLEADNASVVLLGISKCLLGRLQVSQFSLNGSSHRESKLQAKLEAFSEKLKSQDVALARTGNSTAELNGSLLDQTDGAEAKLKDAEDKLISANSEVFTLTEKVASLEKQVEETETQLRNVKTCADEYQSQYYVVCSEVRDMENIIVKLKENVTSAESRANSAEAKCESLTETISKLNEELALLKDGGDTSVRVKSLERQLKESDLRLQNALAFSEASLEKQGLLYSTIRDMAKVIEDLKSKVSKAESRADSAEENCIILSESNAELNEEISFLRSRLECLEGSLHQEEEAKIATAKDIGKRTKVLKNLVSQLTVERERLKQQLYSLENENKVLVVKLKQTQKDP